MKSFKTLLAVAFLSLGSTAAMAQATYTDKDGNEYQFKKHAFINLEGGAQYTLGEAKFKDLISPNVQFGLGYQFNPWFAARLQANGWQSKGGWNGYTQDQKFAPLTQDYKFKYVAPGVDFMFNLSNLFFGWNPNRVFNVTAFLGGGANIGWGNDEVNEISKHIQNVANYNLEYLWDGTKVRPFGRGGVELAFRLSDAVRFIVEGNANILTDKYNSKKADNPDWYFNALAGLRINLGKTFTKTAKPVAEPEPEPAPEVREVKEWANAGFKISPNAGIAEYIQTISQSLYDLDKAGRIADRMRLADSLGIDRTMELFLKEGPEYVMQALREAGAETWLSDPTVARRSAELNTNWEKFKNQFNKMFSDEWLQAANNLVDVLNRLSPTLGTLVNQLGGAVGESLRGISNLLDLFQGKTSLDDFTKAIKENKDFAKEVGSAIGTALGAVVGALTGHPLLGAAIGSMIGKRLGEKSNEASNIEYQEFDWEKYRQGLPQSAELPTNTQFVAGLSLDWLKKNPNIITNIKLDPTQPTDMTQNPDGTWTTRDGRGMTIVSREAM